MKFRMILIMLAVGLLWAQQYPLPITEYDYATAENNVSPIAIGVGGMNLTLDNDPYCSYSNPALLAHMRNAQVFTSFRLTSDKPMSIAEVSSLSNALKSKQFKYFGLSTKQMGFVYQPMSRINISEITDDGRNLYYDYALDKVQLSIAASDEKHASFSGGLSFKYLSGRLVYLKERRSSSTVFVREAFIDNKVKGFSTDLGFMLETGDFRFGAVAYDLLSRLYWESYPSRSISPRLAFSSTYVKDNLAMNIGVMGKLKKQTDSTIHLGLQHNWNWGRGHTASGATIQHNIPLRVGLYSKDFYGTNNINFTFGSGYSYNMILFDFSINSPGLKLRDSEYLFSIGVGLP
ncbi:MAG TPA: hypothetical protein GX398_04730 [Candidatus Cloacimonetes bacterium]|nr:hypothetical protein [Candidatus Cloacimonas sp.]HHZ15396.1 hypothetical protein [Candidatus Cloacimonadota bacterium]